MNTSGLCFHIVVVSDNIVEGRSVDASGNIAREFLESRGYSVREISFARNIPRDIIKALRSNDCRVLIFLGGTGVSPRDITVDTLRGSSWRELPGFGEMYRRLSFEQIGPRALLSRASLFITPEGKVAVALPGSPKGVELGLKLLLDIIEHLIEEVDRYETPHR